MKKKYVCQCEMFMNCGKKAFAKTKCDCQTRNTKGIIDVKEEMCLTNVRYLRLKSEYFLRISILYIYTCVQFQFEIFMNC